MILDRQDFPTWCGIHTFIRNLAIYNPKHTGLISSDQGAHHELTNIFLPFEVYNVLIPFKLQHSQLVSL